ncbi:MAG TPA: flagellar hook-length control protein FliK [Polyangiaceae bacterium]|jgi:hypothetical protein|nr:flagellar hook-length control protein FliK [Polyangiaceae bacterium]
MIDGKIGASGPMDTAAPTSSTEKSAEHTAEQWAAALAASLLVRPTAPRTLGTEPTAAAWRGGDSNLTPAAKGADAGAANESSEASGTERIAVVVDAADLGQLSIAVDRDGSGVRVQISVGNERAAAALEPERLRLLNALAGSGVNVGSVTIVRAGANGTTLAIGTSATLDADGSDGTASNTDRKRLQKKNHFIG